MCLTYLKGRETEIAHPLVLSSNAYNNWNKARPTPGVRNSTLVSCVGGSDPKT